MQRDAALDPGPFGGITGAGDNAALAAGDQRLAPKLRMDGLFAGSKKGVAVKMGYGPRPGLETENKIVHKNTKAKSRGLEDRHMPVRAEGSC